MIRDRLALEFEFIEVLIQRNRRLNAFDDDGVTDPIIDAKSNQRADRRRSEDAGLLELLEPLKFAEGRIAANEPLETARIEFEIIRMAVELKSPDLPVAAILEERSAPGKVFENVLHVRGRHDARV